MKKNRWVALFQRLTRVKPQQATDVSAMLNRALECLRSGRLTEAEQSFGSILKQVPDHFEALYSLGAIEVQRGRLEDAVLRFGQALKVNPQSEGVHANIGAILLSLARPADALASFDRALAIKPNLAFALFNRGNALVALKRNEEALASFDHVLEIKPDYLEALFNRGNVLADLSRHEDALASFDRALALRPDFREALCNRGNALVNLKRPEEALMSLDQALAINPDFPDALNNRGNALVGLERAADALVSLDRALAINPNFSEALNTRGIVLVALKRPEDALASFGRAVAIEPRYADAHWGEALCRLLIGDFELGWKKYEWRWQTDQLAKARREFKEPLWLGEQPLEGKTIFLHSEQGLGDTLQFCRYVTAVSERGAKVVLEVQPAMKSLLACLNGVSKLVVTGDQLPDFDIHCPLLSLPLAFSTELNTIPSSIPYIFSNRGRVRQWQTILGERTVPRIGLVWSGRPEHHNDRNRSIPLAQLATLVSGKAQFISLQKEVRAVDKETLDELKSVLHFGNELRDFADTAALVQLMDVVISVDTSVAHLAGAMGKPVWILLPFIPDWRWLLDRDDSPWYPTAKLFRQPVAGDWSSVIAKIKHELAGFLG